ncbi:hypothetical protein WR25_18975 [Diploscapter pachys]|uniref:SAC3/GANP/THP3 conserved domain-containing protein n=1 Tax=Diploscapter pachys TaxID=2018661 RepID=A0A2A2M0L2_9BILA|nr:hypothetical protein WR25_18975 [Diploscapter pachys]
MPPSGSGNGAENGSTGQNPGFSQNDAWRKAQEGLQKVNASRPPDQVQTQMQQQYPWMTNLGAVGFTPGGFPNPAFQGAYPGMPMAGGFVPQQSGFPYMAARGGPQQFRGTNRGGNWQANRGRGRGFVAGGAQQSQGQATGKFTPFAIGQGQRGGFTPGGSNFTPARGNFHNLQQQTPDSLGRYTQRAYMAANTDEEKKKVQQYMAARLKPLIEAGSVNVVDWDKEPLPHEKNYELPSFQWTPAAKLAGFNASPQKSRSAPEASNKKGKNRGNWKNDNSRRDSGEYNGNKEGDEEFSRAGFRYQPPSKRPQRTRTQSSSSRSSNSSENDSNKKKIKGKKAQKKTEKQVAQKQKQQINSIVKKAPTWKLERARRFANDGQRTVAHPPRTHSQIRSMRVIRGTSTNIEKSYFRLTTAPDPSQVRPLEILEKALDNVKDKYRQRAEYRYLSDQLRSIRQDLTVQRIRDKFTVQVYEINARISLENKDREEFNQCQSQLRLLYQEVSDCPNRAEFLAYRLLYYIAVENQIDIASLLRELTPALKEDECVKFAMNVRRAEALGEYEKFFKLFKNAPKMCPFIMDLFVERARKKALSVIFKAYRPTFQIKELASTLAYEEECDLVDFLRESGVECELGGSVDLRNYGTKKFV